MKLHPITVVRVLMICLITAGTSPAGELIEVQQPRVANSGARTMPVLDVAMREDGLIRGRLVEADGTPIDGARVVMRQKDHVAAAVMTDKKGEFTAEGLPGGVYRIETPTASGNFRFWNKDDAPPAARPVALVVSQNPTLRGQYGYNTGDMLTFGMSAAGLTLGVLALNKAEDAQTQADQFKATTQQITPVSP